MSTQIETSSANEAAANLYDVVIVGGVLGSAIAWHLLEAEPGLRVAVVEPDPTCVGAVSSTASGGIRQLFTRPEKCLGRSTPWRSSTAGTIGRRCNLGDRMGAFRGVDVAD